MWTYSYEFMTNEKIYLQFSHKKSPFLTINFLGESDVTFGVDSFTLYVSFRSWLTFGVASTITVWHE